VAVTVDRVVVGGGVAAPAAAELVLVACVVEVGCADEDGGRVPEALAVLVRVAVAFDVGVEVEVFVAAAVVGRGVGVVATGALVTVPVGTPPRGGWPRPARVHLLPGRLARTKWLAVASRPSIVHEQQVTTCCVMRPPRFDTTT
jgi:hypothetical protein